MNGNGRKRPLQGDVQMQNGGPFGLYTDHDTFQIGFCTLRPDASLVWENTRAGRFIVPTRDLCKANGRDIARLFPTGNLPQNVEISNAGDRLALVFTLALDQNATLIFFGSRAQGTHLPTSDVDLLIIAPDCEYIGATHGALSVYTINPEEARHRALQGDLFFGSLLQTGQVLFDPLDRVKKLTQAYTPCPQPAVKQAAQAIGTLILREGLFEHFPEMVIGRALWCLRTIMLAEGHNPFALADLIDAKDRNAHALLNAARNKNTQAQSAAFAAFRVFMAERDLIESEWLGKDLEAWGTRFENTKNTAGLKTLSLIRSLSKHIRR